MTSTRVIPAKVWTSAEVYNELDDYVSISTLLTPGRTYNPAVHRAWVSAKEAFDDENLAEATHWLVWAACWAGHLTEGLADALDPLR